jgi:tRNA modification GTPase
VRVSGAELRPMLAALVNIEVSPRHAARATFCGADGTAIDDGLVIFFPAPRSYTGEDVIELQAHGGPVVLQLLLLRCVELGARIAKPGEFTQRAFLNGKIDLAQAEGAADLIAASTVEAARCAVRSMQGEFSRRIDAMVQTLIDLRTLVEATLDFPEDDVEFLQQANASARLEQLRAQIAAVLGSSRQGSLLREGIHVVLAGAANVGKSSLLNRLAGSERAIVTDIPGTTRDVIRETMNIRGVPVHMIDTAGLRQTNDPIEKIGISRTWSVISDADLILWVSDASRPETQVVDPALTNDLPVGIRRLQVVNKIDLTGASPQTALGAGDEVVWISAKSGAGLDLLKSSLLAAVGWADGGSEGVFMARARHLEALQTATHHLDAASMRVGELELLAEELKQAQLALSDITGEFTPDDLLGKIFSQFCIGK